MYIGNRVKVVVNQVMVSVKIIRLMHIILFMTHRGENHNEMRNFTFVLQLGISEEIPCNFRIRYIREINCRIS